MEHIITFVSNVIWKHLHKHGFMSGLSWKSQLIETVVHNWVTSMHNKTQINAILIAFAKAFDKVPHNRLLSKTNFIRDHW